MTEFRKFPSIPRLRRACTVTEKIDGTNACVVVEEYQSGTQVDGVPEYRVYAQSRNRLITPDNDNHGFAAWVHEHAATLALTLGSGYHYGEWWGSGIQRGYGLVKGEKRFSLFNTHRWEVVPDLASGYSLGIAGVPELSVVPALYTGPFTDSELDLCVKALRVNGSFAAPGFSNPEGIIVYHHAAKQYFKYTLDGDGHKGN